MSLQLSYLLQLEVIDEREKFALSRCKEALDNTNKSIEQQRAHLERLNVHVFCLICFFIIHNRFLKYMLSTVYMENL